ncbi:MAG: hypothetical protein ABI361_02095 [Nitrososphaera sp.]|jgi:hypothetical protein
MVDINDTMTDALRRKLGSKREVQVIADNYNIDITCPICESEKLIYKSTDAEKMVCVSCTADFDISELIKDTDVDILVSEGEGDPLVKFFESGPGIDKESPLVQKTRQELEKKGVTIRSIDQYNP